MESFFPLYLLAGNLENLVKFYADSSLAGQALTVIMGIFSAGAWCIMIIKHIELTSFKKLNQQFDLKVSRVSSVLSLQLPKNFAELGPYAICAQSALESLKKFSDTESLAIRMGHVENALQRSVAEQTLRYESQMVMLSSVVSGAPFIGLFGTVWGVMDTFGALGEQAQATIQTLAPGVSSALLTTVAGLAVAIPSVFGYNLLLALSRTMVTHLENFASQLADRIELELEMHNASRKPSPSPAAAPAEAAKPTAAASLPAKPAAVARPLPLTAKTPTPAAKPAPAAQEDNDDLTDEDEEAVDREEDEFADPSAPTPFTDSRRKK